MTATQTLLDTALAYHRAARLVLPIAPTTKQPSILTAGGELRDIPWKHYRAKHPTETQIRNWFPPDRPMGIGIACGPTSGRMQDGVPYALEVLDVDNADTLEAFVEAAHWQGHSELLERLLHQRTPGGAGHFGYLCPQWAGNTKLAQRQIGVNGAGKPELDTLIETRGDGGQAVVAPTPPWIHPEHPERGYVLIRGSWENPPIITPEERQILWALARSFNAYVAPQHIRSVGSRNAIDPSGTRPGDALNRRADVAWWAALLEQHDWTHVHASGAIQYWRRPGKEGKAWSATLGACGPYFYVFSSNAHPFEPETAYSAFGAYTFFEHGGNFAEAAKALARDESRPRARPGPPGVDGRQDDPPSTRPAIHITTDMTGIVDAAQAAMVALPEGARLFQRSRQLCFVAYHTPTPKWLIRPPALPVIMPATDARLTELAATAARWQKFDKRSDKWVSAVPPAWFARTLASRGEWTFPALEGIVYAPTLRQDGSILATPGYDKDTGLILAGNGTAYPPVPPSPTLDDAQAALVVLKEPFQDFPFAHPYDQSAALSYVLTLVARHAIAGPIPLGGIDANTRGTGKGLLADVIAMIGTGRPATKWPQVAEEDEERKRLFAIGMAGYPIVCIDNVTHALGSPALDMALTSLVYADRQLGLSHTPEVPMTAVFLATGNNLLYKEDLLRRVVPITLFSHYEHPEERNDLRIKRLLPWVHEHRPQLVVAALTILRAFCVAGKPQQDCKPIGSYEAWSDGIRQALVWVGEEDPASGRAELEETSANPELAHFRTFLECWLACYAETLGTPRTLKSVLYELQDKMGDGKHDKQGTPLPRNEWDELRDALGAFDTRYDGHVLRNAKGAGYALGRYKGRLFDKKRFVAGERDRTKSLTWKLELFSGHPPPAGNAGNEGNVPPYAGKLSEEEETSEENVTSQENVTSHGLRAGKSPSLPALPAPVSASEAGETGSAGQTNGTTPTASADTFLVSASAACPTCGHRWPTRRPDGGLVCSGERCATMWYPVSPQEGGEPCTRF